eukprot:1447620-Lingulodinium_polyedra.AAC.1
MASNAASLKTKMTRAASRETPGALAARGRPPEPAADLSPHTSGRAHNNRRNSNAPRISCRTRSALAPAARH